MAKVNLLSQEQINRLEKELLSQSLAEGQGSLDSLEMCLNSINPKLSFRRDYRTNRYGKISYIGTMSLSDEENILNLFYEDNRSRLGELGSIDLEYTVSVNVRDDSCSFEINSGKMSLTPHFFTRAQLEKIFDMIRELNRTSYMIHNALRSYAEINGLTYSKHPNIQYEDPNQAKIEV